MCIVIREAALPRYGWNGSRFRLYYELRIMEGECPQKLHPGNGRNRTSREHSVSDCPECANVYDTSADTWKLPPAVRVRRLRLSYRSVDRPPHGLTCLQKFWKNGRPCGSLWRRYQSLRRSHILMS